MKRAVLVAAASTLSLATPLAARAQSLRLMNTAVVEYWGDNGNDVSDDDDFGVAIEKLYLNGQMDRTSVALQVDAMLFSNYPDVADPSPTNPSAFADQAHVERLLVTHRFDNATVALGDFHQQLGRGLALSLRKVDELGTDQALRGGSLAFEADPFSATAFAGVTNIANMDGVTRKFLEDPQDTLVGGGVTWQLGTAQLSVHGLYLQPKVPVVPTQDDDQTVLGGAFVDLPAFDWFSLYLEGAVEEHRVAGRAEQGNAAYVAADIDLAFVQLLVEGLRLERFQVWGSQDPTLGQRNVYNLPPTLERIDQEVLDNRDVRGGRVKISKAFLEGDLVFYVSGMLRRYGLAPAEVDAVHGYGGFELTYGAGLSRWYASGGYREETEVGEVEPLKTMIHAETDWVQAVGGGWALHLMVNHEERTLEERPYRRGSTLVGFDRFNLGSLMAEIGYDTQNPNNRQLYLAGILAWHPDSDFHLRAVVGSQRGGLKCIGGICRDFPPFAGVRLEATLTHDLL